MPDWPMDGKIQGAAFLHREERRSPPRMRQIPEKVMMGYGTEVNFGFGQVHFGKAQDAGDHHEGGGGQAESVDGATDGFVAENWAG